jgi:hypothetical protein
MTYIRLEQKLRNQDAPGIGRAFVALEIVALLITLIFADIDSNPELPLRLVAGIPITLLGMFLYNRLSSFWGRALICIGGAPLLFFLAWLSPLLALIAAIIYVLAVCVSVVA